MTPPKVRRADEHRTDEQRVADLERTVERYIEERRLPQGDTAARVARRRAAHFTALVREEGPDGIGTYLDALELEQLYALVVTLAAMVPVDTPAAELLAWLEAEERVA